MFNNKLKKLREQEDLIYRNFRSGDRVQEIEEYFDVYLEVMRKNVGNINQQLLCATVFAKYISTFILADTNHLSIRQVQDMRFAAQKVLMNLRDGGSFGDL